MIGANLKKICDEKNVTMYRLSKETGVSQSYLSEIINGTANNPTSKILLEICGYLEISVDSLLAGRKKEETA